MPPIPSDSALNRLTKAQLIDLVRQLRAVAPLGGTVHAGVAEVAAGRPFDPARAALAVRLAGELEGASGTVVPNLAKELRAVMAEIEAGQAAEVPDDADGDTTGPVDPVSILDARVARLSAV